MKMLLLLTTLSVSFAYAHNGQKHHADEAHHQCEAAYLKGACGHEGVSYERNNLGVCVEVVCSKCLDKSSKMNLAIESKKAVKEDLCQGKKKK
jgi:hypothetical protein